MEMKVKEEPVLTPGAWHSDVLSRPVAFPRNAKGDLPRCYGLGRVMAEFQWNDGPAVIDVPAVPLSLTITLFLTLTRC